MDHGPRSGETGETNVRSDRPYKIGGLLIPLFDYNRTDGLGFGLGIEIYDRKRELDFGYRNRITAWTFWTTSGNYSSNYVQYERRGSGSMFVARVAYRVWKDMQYVGAGGDDVLVRNLPEREGGNTVYGPSLLTTALVPMKGTPLYVWAQGYARYTLSEARPGGILEERQPYGLGEAFYFDVSAGVAVQEVDRWPLPNKGVRAEASVRGGGSVSNGQAFEPLVGVNAEVIGWWPLVGDRLVIGARAVVDKTWGKRPFWEQEWLGGQLRDENAYEQMVTGYNRSRSRGDGLVANLVELRGRIGRTRHPFWDLEFYVSAFAESAFLFDEGELEAHLPSVGFGPELLWQGVVQLRPF
ncbi:MAG: hypothetical protein KC656_32065, partial [Myxococcales bacterium]|nr:hypothetical protein [Myxococcales bacterium]